MSPPVAILMYSQVVVSSEVMRCPKDFPECPLWYVAILMQSQVIVSSEVPGCPKDFRDIATDSYTHALPGHM